MTGGPIGLGSALEKLHGELLAPPGGDIRPAVCAHVRRRFEEDDGGESIAGGPVASTPWELDATTAPVWTSADKDEATDPGLACKTPGVSQDEMS